MNKWVISDTHWGHTKIIECENRPFSSTEEMDEVMIQNWNSVVQDDDLVYHLGDIFLCGAPQAHRIQERLKGTIVLFLGNHDHFTVGHYQRMGFVVEKEPRVVDGMLFSHYPSSETIVKNVHGHVHSRIQDLDQRIYKCVSVECTNYTPLHFDELMSWKNKK